MIHKNIKSGLFVFSNQLIERVVYLTLYIVLAHISSKNEYGIIITIFAFSNIIQILFDFGFPFYIQREIASDQECISKLNTVFTIKYLSFPIVILIELVYLSFIRNINPVWVLVIGSSNFLQSINQIYSSVLYGKELYKEQIEVNALSKVIYFLFVLSVFFLKNNIILFLLALIVSNSYLLYRQREVFKSNILKKYKYMFSLKGYREIFLSSLKIGGGLIFVTIYDRIDILIIQMLMSYENVAVYSVAYSLFRSTQMIGTGVLMPIYTKYSAIYKRNHNFIFSKIKHDGLLLIALSGCIIIAAGLFGEWIVKLFFGNAYYYSGMVLFVLTFALPGVFMNNFTGVIANSSRKEKIPLITTFIGVLIGITINFILIPVVGIYGAVVATIITEYSVFILQYILLKPSLIKK